MVLWSIARIATMTTIIVNTDKPGKYRQTFLGLTNEHLTTLMPYDSEEVIHVAAVFSMLK